MEDRRVRKSKTALKQALIAMLKKKDASKITVKEICDLADVNRSTFYKNYADIFELFKAVQYDIFDEINETMDDNLWVSVGADSTHRFLGFKETIYSIAERKEQLLLLSKNDMNDSFKINMLEYYMEKQKIETEDIGLKYMFTYHTMGYFSVIYSWLEGGCVMPCDKVAEFIWNESANLRKELASR